MYNRILVGKKMSDIHHHHRHHDRHDEVESSCDDDVMPGCPHQNMDRENIAAEEVYCDAVGADASFAAASASAAEAVYRDCHCHLPDIVQ